MAPKTTQSSHVGSRTIPTNRPVGKIAFVIPWYGLEATGGAESLCRSTALQLKAEGFEVEVLTTCVKNFRSDWNEDFWKPGTYLEEGITIRRFLVRKRDVTQFDMVNSKLMQGIRATPVEEKIYIEQMIRSPALIDYIRSNEKKYNAFLPIPYMFGTSYETARVVSHKTYLIPCLHDESYAYMRIFREAYAKVKGCFFNTYAEKDLAQKILGLRDDQCYVAGVGINSFTPRQGAFRKRYHIEGDYILYAGRKDIGKNVFLLMQYMDMLVQETETSLKLILIGNGRVDIPEAKQHYIIDLGLVSEADKQAALSDATIFCIPSVNESFSIVMMEAWIARRPVLVHGKCAVTREHVERSQGGLWFESYEEFREAVQYLLTHRDVADLMGKNGGAYVKNNYTPKKVTDTYVAVLAKH